MKYFKGIEKEEDLYEGKIIILYFTKKDIRLKVRSDGPRHYYLSLYPSFYDGKDNRYIVNLFGLADEQFDEFFFKILKYYPPCGDFPEVHNLSDLFKIMQALENYYDEYYLKNNRPIA